MSLVKKKKMTEHPITPPPELVQQWLCDDGYPWDPSENATITITTNRLRNVATQAARWGADQELEACCEYLSAAAWEKLLKARRSQPPTLKQQALKSWEECWGSGFLVQKDSHADVIRRALEALPDE